jgi:hypothetical protein
MTTFIAVVSELLCDTLFAEDVWLMARFDCLLRLRYVWFLIVKTWKSDLLAKLSWFSLTTVYFGA